MCLLWHTVNIQGTNRTRGTFPVWVLKGSVLPVQEAPKFTLPEFLTSLRRENMELLKIISPCLTFLHHLYHNSRTKWGQSSPSVRPSVRPLPSYPPALLRTTLTEPECRHLTPRAHWHHLKPRMGSVCAAEPRIIAQSGANGPVQTVWAAAVPPCDEAHRESSRRPPGILAVPSASASGPASFHQNIFQQFSKENGTNKQTNQHNRQKARTSRQNGSGSPGIYRLGTGWGN